MSRSIDLVRSTIRTFDAEFGAGAGLDELLCGIALALGLIIAAGLLLAAAAMGLVP